MNKRLYGSKGIRSDKALSISDAGREFLESQIWVYDVQYEDSTGKEETCVARMKRKYARESKNETAIPCMYANGPSGVRKPAKFADSKKNEPKVDPLTGILVREGMDIDGKTYLYNVSTGDIFDPKPRLAMHARFRSYTERQVLCIT